MVFIGYYSAVFVGRDPVFGAQTQENRSRDGKEPRELRNDGQNGGCAKEGKLSSN